MSCPAQFSSRNKKAFLATLERRPTTSLRRGKQGVYLVHWAQWQAATSVRPSDGLPGASMTFPSSNTPGMCRRGLPSTDFVAPLSN